jgi:hypothetical protein
VVGTRPVRVKGRCVNQGYLWSAATGLRPLRSKYFLPEEPGSWEATWFQRGDAAFPVYYAGPLSFGLNICTELWALETYADYAALGAELLLSPAATAAPRRRVAGRRAWWRRVRSGAFSVSSNRVDRTARAAGAAGSSIRRATCSPSRRRRAVRDAGDRSGEGGAVQAQLPALRVHGRARGGGGRPSRAPRSASTLILRRSAGSAPGSAPARPRCSAAGSAAGSATGDTIARPIAAACGPIPLQ